MKFYCSCLFREYILLYVVLFVMLILESVTSKSLVTKQAYQANRHLSFPFVVRQIYMALPKNEIAEVFSVHLMGTEGFINEIRQQ